VGDEKKERKGRRRKRRVGEGVDVKVLGSVSFKDGSVGFGEIVWFAQPDQSATKKCLHYHQLPPPLGKAAHL
jgi:hypothetical protein